MNAKRASIARFDAGDPADAAAGAITAIAIGSAVSAAVPAVVTITTAIAVEPRFNRASALLDRHICLNRAAAVAIALAVA